MTVRRFIAPRRDWDVTCRKSSCSYVHRSQKYLVSQLGYSGTQDLWGVIQLLRILLEGASETALQTILQDGFFESSTKVFFFFREFLVTLPSRLGRGPHVHFIEVD
jgi:hypothetical protein